MNLIDLFKSGPINLGLLSLKDEPIESYTGGGNAEDSEANYEFDYPDSERSVQPRDSDSNGELDNEDRMDQASDEEYEGQSLLHRATARADYTMAKLLFDHGAAVNQRDQNGRTALMANADRENERVLKLLLTYGADTNLTQREGCHELYEAAVYGATEVVKFFLENGVNPPITNNFGWTPLHGAAANGHLDCVRLLLDKGAEPSPISDTGKTPRDFVHLGQKHYDRILAGEEHYKAQALKAREVNAEDPIWRKDEILHLLEEKGALTSDELYRKKGGGLQIWRRWTVQPPKLAA
ncbi:ankyrin repeat-containing domain protein [Durotheca rogersii]|uniref:ankyrin repeat-containing domain protein n=1 Tax=Durotheca rogersii TaxID=419775 RepID=UPI0022204219|nr:ankyrin repeat-containing domain protein [Durotheca rogersii]KAI5867925.1 ankyrin repeat-containing domain protein [Durotheca rogersii]